MLTPEQQRHAMDWFAAKSGGMACPVCRKASWKVETDATLPDVRNIRPPIETVIVGCVNCGHFLLFSGSILECPIPPSP